MSDSRQCPNVSSKTKHKDGFVPPFPMRRADQLQGLLVELLRSTMSHHPRRKIEILGEVMHAGGQSD